MQKFRPQEVLKAEPDPETGILQVPRSHKKPKSSISPRHREMSHLCVRWMMINAMVRCYWNPCSVAWVQPLAEPLVQLRSMRIHTWEAKYLKVPKMASQNVQKSKKAPNTTIICLWAAAIVAAIGDCSLCFLFVVFACVSNCYCNLQNPTKPPTPTPTFPLQNPTSNKTTDTDTTISLAEPSKPTGLVLARCARRAVSEKVL